MQRLSNDQLEYIQYCREQRGLSDHSLRAYEQDLATFHRWTSAGDVPVGPDDEAVVRFHRYLRFERQASPSTVRRRIVALKAFMNWRARRDRLRPPSFAEIDLDLRVPRRLPRPIERDDLSKVLSNSPHIVPRHDCPSTQQAERAPATMRQTTGLAVRLLIATGMRIGELTNLKINEVHRMSGRIRILGKGDKERTVYVTNEKLLADIASYLDVRLEIATHNDPFLINTRGSRLTDAAFRKRLRRTSDQLDFAVHITPHQFRHSAATLLIEEGVDIRLVQRLLGHVNIATTEIYTKVSDVSLRRAIEQADTLSTVDNQL